MDEQLKQEITDLVKAAMNNDEQAMQYIQKIMEAAQTGDPKAAEMAQMIQQVAQQLQGQQAQKARFGAKLAYIKRLKGICPEGQEMQFFKKGGVVCKKCMPKVAKKGCKVKKGAEGLKSKASNNTKSIKRTGVFRGNTDGGTEKITYFSDGSESYELNENGVTYVTDRRGKMYNSRDHKAQVDSVKTVDSQPYVPSLKRHNRTASYANGDVMIPFTGFEGMQYEHHPAKPSTQGRADRPEIEIINNGDYEIQKSTYYDPYIYEDTGKLQFDFDVYDMTENGEDWTTDLTETQMRAFDSLKRHALMNQKLNSRYGRPGFNQGLKKN